MNPVVAPIGSPDSQTTRVSMTIDPSYRLANSLVHRFNPFQLMIIIILLIPAWTDLTMTKARIRSNRVLQTLERLPIKFPFHAWNRRFLSSNCNLNNYSPNVASFETARKILLLKALRIASWVRWTSKIWLYVSNPINHRRIARYEFIDRAVRRTFVVA